MKKNIPPLTQFVSNILGIKNISSRPELTSAIYHFHLPAESDCERKWKAFPQFKGKTRSLDSLSCHASVLRNGHRPHPSHAHADEELLVLLSGEIDVIVKDNKATTGLRRRKLKPFEFMYYPAYYAHTLETTSNEPAVYVMFKWHAQKKNKMPVLTHGHFMPFSENVEIRNTSRLYSYRIFEGATSYCRKLHAHASVLMPGVSYAPHVDDYDVAIIVLDGDVETLNQRAKNYNIIFYAAGTPHGMHNPSQKPARYLVFEFHGYGISSFFRKTVVFLRHIAAYATWKRKIKSLSEKLFQ